MEKKSGLACLYIATFDPTISSSGTATRGKLFLRYFSNRYRVHLVHMKEKRGEGRDDALIGELESATAVPHSPAGYFFFSRKLFDAVYTVLKSTHIDFIFADFEKAGLYGYLASRKYGIPFIYNTHNVEYLRYINVARTNRLRYLFVPYMYLLERVSCRHALLTVTISEPDAQVFRKWVTPDRVLVMHCAFDEDEINPFYEAIFPDPPVILMVGNYSNAGNRDGALVTFREILPKVIEQIPDAVFRFIGQYLPPEINHPNVQAPGFVKDLRAEYARASVVIAPINIGGGIKIKVIEALASGKYLITTGKGMEGIDATGLEQVRVTDVDHFATEIIKAIQAGQGVTQQNWEQVSERYGVRHSLVRLVEHLEQSLGRQSAALSDHEVDL